MNMKRFGWMIAGAVFCVGLLRWAVAQQPVGHWPFDEGSGTNTVDVSGNNATGTLAGAVLPVWTSGVSSNSLVFDGFQNEVQVPDAPALSPTNALSLTAWVKTATNLTSDVLGKWSTNQLAGSYILGLTNGWVKLELMLGGQPVTLVGAGASLPSTNWNLIAGSYNGTQLVVYVNGQATGSQAASGTVDVVTEPLRMGLLSGRLDDVRLYDVALTTNQVAALVNADSDGDGMPDWWEASHGLNPNLNDVGGDLDGDGRTNLHEYQRGTDPQQFNQLFAPVARAGTNQPVVAGTNGLAAVTLDGSASSDADGTIVSYAWREGTNQLSLGASPSVNLGLGVHTITLTVTDDDGQTGSTNTTITVASSPFAAWGWQMPVTASGYTRATVLTNFPMLVVLGTNLTGFSYSQFSSPQGWDLRFSDPTGTNELPYEIEQWNTNGSSYVWVRAPLLSSNATFTAYWGNNSASQPAYTTNGAVWVNGFAGVWHMNQISPASDSTSNHNDLVNTAVTATNSPVGAAAHFNGSSAKFEKATSASLTLASNLTMSAWVKYAAASESYNAILEKQTASDYVFFWGVKQTANTLATYFYNNNNPQRSIDGGGAALSTGVWTHVTATWDSSTIKTFLNAGVNQSASAAATPWTPGDGIFSLGHSRYGSGRWFNGDMDEVRVSSVARSADWLWAEYLNMASNATFNAYGAVSIGSGVTNPPSITSAAPTNGLAGLLYSYVVSVNGAPTPGLAVSGNPAWLSLSGNTLSGTPPATGVYGPITLTASNGVSPNATQTFSITVNGTAAAPAITSTAPTNDTVGAPYAYAVTMTGTPTPGLSVIGLPSWLTLSNNTLSGTPSATGSYGPITLTASNGVSPDATQTFSITVNAPPLITSTAQTNAVVAVPYSYTVATTGAPTPGLSASGLPSWLTMTNNTLSGTPPATGSYGPITLTASNGVASNAVQTFSITVASSPFASWNWQMPVTASGYTRATVLTNFPMLVVLGTNLTGFSYSQFSSPQGWDLRFSDPTGTNELPYEIEQWNTNGSSYVWVRAPLLSSNATFTAYWGNNSASQPAYTTNGAVWVNGFAGVWHMNQISPASDSTSNHNDLVNTAVTATNSPVGAAAHFNGSSAKFEKATSASLTLASNLTMSAWVKYAAASESYNAILEKQTASAYVFFWGVKQTANTLATYFYNNNNPQRSIDGGGAALSTGVWTHVTATWDSSTIKTFLNAGANQSASAAAAPWTPGDGIFSLGHAKYGSGRWFNGDMDEVRVSSVARSADWLWAEYLNMASNTTFNSYGAITPINPAVASFTASPTNGAAPLTVNFDASASSGTAPLTYAWNFGDGQNGSGVTASHTYTNVAAFTATLTVTDAYGNTNAQNKAIRAYDPVYSTPGDGIPDWWKAQYGFATNDPGVAAADTDGDGLSNYLEYRLGTDPLNAASQVTPTVAIQSGNNQGSVTNAFLLQPLVVSVRTNGQVLSAVPVQFTMTQGGALLSTNQGATLTNVVVVSTGTNGLAQVWLRTSAVAETNLVTAGIANCTNVVSASFIATSHAIPWDMMGWWAFDEGSGTNTLDVSGYNGLAALTTNGVTWFSSGVVSNALAFDGTGAVGLPPTVALNTVTNELTVCAFVNTTSTVDQVVCSYQAQDTNSGWRVFANTSGLRFQWVSGDGAFHELVSTNGLPAGQWAQVAVTLAPGQATLWVDAQVVAVDTNAGTGLLLGGTNGFWIGASDNGTTHQFNGVIDELQIYRRALSTDELSALLNIDSDGDGMPNYWERNHGLNPYDPSDASLDPDGDGLSNLLEYLHGGDPHNAHSFDSVIPDGWYIAHPGGTQTQYLQDAVLRLRVYTPLE